MDTPGLHDTKKLTDEVIFDMIRSEILTAKTEKIGFVGFDLKIILF